MQRRTAYILALVAIIALGTGWYFFNQGTQGQESTAIDRSALVRMHSPSEGRVDAPVVIVEFFDPACGTCREFYPRVKQLIAENPGRIRLVMRYAPFHKGSDKVVAVLEAARRQGKFWQTLEALFDSQDEWASNHTAKVRVSRILCKRGEC